MTPEELAAIEARANAATPGPWHSWCYNKNNPSYAVDVSWDAPIARGDSIAGMIGREQNVAFIASCREDVPRLIAYIRELEDQAAARREARR